MDCGPACIRMITKFFGRTVSPEKLRRITYASKGGTSLLNLSEAAESLGFRTLAVKVSLEKLQKAPLPCIVFWQQRHFVVVYKIGRRYIHVADPAHGIVKYRHADFVSGWYSDRSNEGEGQGIALLFEPTPALYESEDDFEKSSKPNKKGFGLLWPYLRSHRKLIFQLGLGFLLGSILQLIFPFLAQSMVDMGIHHQNIGFVYTILLAQLMLFLSRITVESIRRWILLHISTRLQISLISDFLMKLMRLPVAFFDAKQTGDLMQRIHDSHRIENFLTVTSLSFVFSIFNLFIFGAIILLYSPFIFLIFTTFSAVSITWITFFMKKRRELDYKRFDRMSENQQGILQIIMGMQEIKLSGSEKQKRWKWESLQAKLFTISRKALGLGQVQETGTLFINELKNIMITFIAAKETIDGHITLGAMMAIQYMIGQLNAPIDQMILFLQHAQDAKLSLERLSEIHTHDDEDHESDNSAQLPQERSIRLDRVSFQYEGPRSPYALKDVNLPIHEGKITAIVGESGSGKTTLLKLLLKFYTPTEGKISVGSDALSQISASFWRRQCGVVMQDGYIFSDTIAHNIAPADETVDYRRLIQALEAANIRTFIESLPLRYNTKIGNEGLGLSQGQKQRILIARAVYKNPQYLFFDEATSALDATNERIIMYNLQRVFQNKTVVIIAHRLSTVRNADQIIVLEKGNVVESGSHIELTQQRGVYFELVRNQLELGN